MNPWDLVRQKLEQILSTESFQNWFSRTKFHSVDGSILRVSVPDGQTRRWLESEYSDQVMAALRSLGAALKTVEYEIAAGATVHNGRASHAPDDGAFSDGENHTATFSARFTFDNYVVGASNQFAHAAAKSVANAPARSYNPLFIYGGTGLGKTHLIQAIGRSLVCDSKMRVVYTTSERFTNEVVTGIRFDRMAQLRQRYRSADVLLIDDIQMLGNKERTQEEFFHTFNELHENQKQIVISSDAPPKEIHGLVDRVRSRFEWGLIADIQPPDLETKMAILDKKAEDSGVVLPDDVRTFIATRSKGNVRELEGALIKLLAVNSLTGAPINMGMAQQTLKNLLHQADRRLTIDGIQKAVADKFGIKQSALKEKSNTKAIVYPRQIAMYLAKELTTASLPEIGRSFGNKHHTTVLHSVEKIKREKSVEPELNRILHSLTDSLS